MRPLVETRGFVTPRVATKWLKELMAPELAWSSDCRRQSIADIEDEFPNADAFGDEIDPADVLTIIAKSKLLPEPEAHEYD